ncbi:MAG: protease modulator HflK [Ruminococcaceae bacterium]|nr:protease modulator HflK [Oscillospiraceae bacterium]
MKQKNLFSEVLGTVTKYFLILVILVMILIFCSGIRMVDSGHVAVVLRFGELVGDTPEEQIHEPGLLLAFPYIIDEVIMVPVDTIMEQNVTTYYTPEDGKSTDGAYVITGDQNIAVLSASVKYVVSDPVAYALNVADMESVINGAVSTALLTQAAGTDVDVMLTTGKDAFAAQSMSGAMEHLNRIGAGVRLTSLELTTISMAPEVREIYNQVNSAAIDAATILENARNHTTTLIPYAQGLAAQSISEANSQKMVATAEARKNLTEFNGLLDEFTGNPEVVKTRVYSTKIAEIIASIGTIRVVQDGETKIILTP